MKIILVINSRKKILFYLKIIKGKEEKTISLLCCSPTDWNNVEFRYPPIFLGDGFELEVVNIFIHMQIFS
jgi:hypothetical protein